MDQKDLHIMNMLRKNARIPKSEIARKLGITEAAVRKRIKKLEERKVILGYRAIVDYRKINMVCSYTGIDVEPEALINTIKELRRIREVASLYLTTGDHDILAEIVCKSINELEEIHNKIASLPGIKRICPAIVTEIIELKDSEL